MPPKNRYANRYREEQYDGIQTMVITLLVIAAIAASISLLSQTIPRKCGGLDCNQCHTMKNTYIEETKKNVAYFGTRWLK